MNDLSDAAEDHLFRSNYIENLVRASCLEVEPTSCCNIPKDIIQYWHDENDLPDDVRECIESWSSLLDKGFKKYLFTDEKAKEFIANNFDSRYLSAFNRCHHPAMRCDYFRLCYLYVKGGFYVDADEMYLGLSCKDLFLDDRLKVHPLCYDKATDQMISSDRFIKNGETSSEWIFYVNNNPIVAPSNHPLIFRALERATTTLLNHDKKLDIQATTGPGNLTASLVLHAIQLHNEQKENDFLLIQNWDEISFSKWPLSYRNDERNWRLCKI